MQIKTLIKFEKYKFFSCQEKILDSYFCLVYYTYCCVWSKEVIMEKIVERSILYDFYGELLTEHQKNIYEDFVLNDFA